MKRHLKKFLTHPQKYDIFYHNFFICQIFHYKISFSLKDRKKNLVKLQHGEYISLGKIESELKTCQIVENICVYADSTKTYCLALVQPAEQALVNLGKCLGLKTNFEQLCQHQNVISAALKMIGEHGKDHGLNKFEIPTKIELCTEAWTPDSGLVTAAFKIKRREIYNKYSDVIRVMYT